MCGVVWLQCRRMQSFAFHMLNISAPQRQVLITNSITQLSLSLMADCAMIAPPIPKPPETLQQDGHYP